MSIKIEIKKTQDKLYPYTVEFSGDRLLKTQDEALECRNMLEKFYTKTLR